MIAQTPPKRSKRKNPRNRLLLKKDKLTKGKCSGCGTNSSDDEGEAAQHKPAIAVHVAQKQEHVCNTIKHKNIRFSMIVGHDEFKEVLMSSKKGRMQGATCGLLRMPTLGCVKSYWVTKQIAKEPFDINLL